MLFQRKMTWAHLVPSFLGNSFPHIYKVLQGEYPQDDQPEKAANISRRHR